jgi:uncharacterized protein (TIGR00255 family)
MSLFSMTGFSRSSATRGGMHWQWDIKSVNGKALDIRCRLPAGFEHLEVPVRERVGRKIKRGNLQISLVIQGTAGEEIITVNEAALAQVIEIARRLQKDLGGEPPRAEGLLALRGILEPIKKEDDEQEAKLRDEAMLSSLDEAIAGLVAARQAEGSKLADVIHRQLDRIAELTSSARDNPARSPEAIRARLAEQVQRLLDASSSFEPERLHQEAVLLATRADIQEEIDRLKAHVEAARKLVASPDPAGRAFDFLAQEFNREANTLCSKASDTSLTHIGLELKTVIDQMREQVQNIE